ncbi:MAG: murein biosynthesis integral membrane protein MurJ, partial [Treponema sp.]|nr:murein biosynthesis integral membrane protein MurJ [Treponema sp.]
FLSPVLRERFAACNHITAYGAPFAINALIFLTLGIILLSAVKDQNIIGLYNMMRRRAKKDDS